MDHKQAISIHAAEGYLLGDLTAAERNGFEEHFFDCDACFSDVRDGATVVAGVRAEATPAPVRGGQHRFFPRFAVAASIAVALLSCTVGYQAFELAKLREPRLVPVHQMPRDQRGAKEDEVIADGRAPFILDFDITLDPASAPFICKIADSRGKTHGDPVSVTAAQARYPVDLQVPGGLLAPGDYSLIVTGTGGSVPEKRFKVR